jgi:8-amino-7-oxononanoate synthase
VPTHSLDALAKQKLLALEERHLLRRLETTDPDDGVYVTRGGQRLLNFCSNDYLNLTQHPEVRDAAIEAVRRYGAGSGASRLVTGNHTLHEELEAALARLKQTDAACVFGSGYLTNLGVIPTLVGPGDLIVLDALSHACIHAGTRLSGAEAVIFEHNDLDHAEAILRDRRSQSERTLIVTDGVFSMDGDLAPLPELADLAERYDAWLMTDDAHGVGVLGDGRGSTHAAGCTERVPLQMGTLSKAIGSYGGYLCASQPVIDWLKSRARPLVYSTGLPPASAAASLAALRIIERDGDYCKRPVELARRFTEAVGLETPESCIVPLLLGEPERALAASETLAKRGFLVTAIRPPTVPAGTARLRITFTAGHPEEEVDRLAHVVKSDVL